ncbi:uncharacterized protein EV420DRAFT_1260941, partial [Desarmillaria tabescens]
MSLVLFWHQFLYQSDILEFTSATAQGPPPRAGTDVKSTLWEFYNYEARTSDKDMLKHWHDDMSTLLIVAALFSAVLTAFIIEFYRKLEPDYTAISAYQQHTMSINIQALLNASLNLPAEPIYDAVDPVMEFQPSPAIVWTVGLWFSALACSISVVVLAWLVKLWFLAYMKGMNNGNAYDCAHRRQYRHDALLMWKVPAIVAALPVLIHMTITLFLTGLVILLWSQINSPAAYIVLIITISMILAYSITTLLPLFYEACPY